ncbi:hypothetical protein R3P38DRAFT_3205773 [Favolaschia claudopus]|uniref:Uncharacterized protein n=1 Tax=Favolaschia claudopus TaxID=2862362 RepID=A0AAW0ANQ4_9AGAR
MVNPYLDWIWSKYFISPQQDMLSLRETCSSLTKYTLLPSDIVLSGGGYILRRNLATTLSHVTCAMDYLLDLSAKHLGLVEIPTIGHTELDILAGTGVGHGLATQNQVVTNWVVIIDRIWAAKHQLKALCAGDVAHHSLHSWDSQVGYIASFLPLELRQKLPRGFTSGCDIKIEEQPPRELTRSVGSLEPRTDTPSSIPLDVSLDELVPGWRSWTYAELTSTYISNLGNGQYGLDLELLFFVMDTVKQMQSLLTALFLPSMLQPACFQIDPHGLLERMLRDGSNVELLAETWKALIERIQLAHERFKEYQYQRREQQARIRTNILPAVSMRGDQPHFPPPVSSSSSSPAPSSALSEGTVELGGRGKGQRTNAAHSPTSELEEWKHRRGIETQEQNGRTAAFQSPPPAPSSRSPSSSIAHNGMAEIGGRADPSWVAGSTSSAESGGQEVAATNTNVSSTYKRKTLTVDIQANYPAPNPSAKSSDMRNVSLTFDASSPFAVPPCSTVEHLASTTLLVNTSGVEVGSFQTSISWSSLSALPHDVEERGSFVDESSQLRLSSTEMGEDAPGIGTSELVHAASNGLSSPPKPADEELTERQNPPLVLALCCDSTEPSFTSRAKLTEKENGRVKEELNEAERQLDQSVSLRHNCSLTPGNLSILPSPTSPGVMGSDVGETTSVVTDVVSDGTRDRGLESSDASSTASLLAAQAVIQREERIDDLKKSCQQDSNRINGRAHLTSSCVRDGSEFEGSNVGSASSTSTPCSSSSSSGELELFVSSDKSIRKPEETALTSESPMYCWPSLPPRLVVLPEVRIDNDTEAHIVLKPDTSPAPKSPSPTLATANVVEGEGLAAMATETLPLTFPVRLDGLGEAGSWNEGVDSPGVLTGARSYFVALALASATVRTNQDADAARDRRGNCAPFIVWEREGIGTSAWS